MIYACTHVRINTNTIMYIIIFVLFDSIYHYNNTEINRTLQLLASVLYAARIANVADIN